MRGFSLEGEGRVRGLSLEGEVISLFHI